MMSSASRSNQATPAEHTVKPSGGRTGARNFSAIGGSAFGGPYTERHLQCVWFDEGLRPKNLKTERGQEIIVEHPGQWNLEEGPDFLGAVLRVLPEGRRLTGDVEIHVHPGAWQQHGHAKNPAYARVIAHVTYFPGAAPRAALPEGAIQVALQDALAANPFFSFESLDLSAYPYAARARATPCAQVLQGWDPGRVAQLLETAGEQRLQAKTARMAGAIAAQGFAQTLYEEVMAALGYKNNRAPFRCLAQRLPLETLRALSAGDPLKAYALLMGVAGLLPRQTPGRWDAATRVFVRRLWDHWWKQQAALGATALRRADWKLSGLRPQNHPQRRLMLAALLFAGKPELEARLSALPAAEAAEAIKLMAALFPPLADATLRSKPSLRSTSPPADKPETETYWQRRLTFGGKPQETPIALMGEGRIAALIANVLLPLLAAAGNRSVMRPAFLRHLPPEEDNQILRQTARNLLGADHNPALYRSGLRQQGLLQIFHDFCLTDRSRCATCALLAALKKESRD
ncbi:MAG: DUF2851 family protein [Lentisphaerae bacterium]|nr:DUF2851 family protein [Lentisphaerota bacterium]